MLEQGSNLRVKFLTLSADFSVVCDERNGKVMVQFETTPRACGLVCVEARNFLNYLQDD